MKRRARQMFRAAGRANFAGPLLVGYFAADLTSGDSLAAGIGRGALMHGYFTQCVTAGFSERQALTMTVAYQRHMLTNGAADDDAG